jgi:hypothetical protein
LDVSTQVLHVNELVEVRDQLSERGIFLWALISESPTNPHLRVMDLDRLVEIGRKHQVKIAIDSTFATPYNQRPVDFGIDLVLHSATKYLGGHADGEGVHPKRGNVAGRQHAFERERIRGRPGAHFVHRLVGATRDDKDDSRRQSEAPDELR